MPKYKCIGCGKIHDDNNYSKEDGDILINERNNKIEEILLRYFNPDTYSLADSDFYLISHIEYSKLKDELNDAEVSGDEQ